MLIDQSSIKPQSYLLEMYIDDTQQRVTKFLSRIESLFSINKPINQDLKQLYLIMCKCIWHIN